MRQLLVLTLSAALCGCAASNAVVRSQVMSFDDIIEDTTDKLLVLNILRAKDKAPLHFDEIPLIHESITSTVSAQGVWPFGPVPKTSPARNTLTAGLGLQLAPTFDLDNLATKDFVTGMSTPIDPKFVKYWLDRGLDRRVVLLLFFSAIDVTVTIPATAAKPASQRTIRIRNSPRDAIDELLSVRSEPLPRCSGGAADNPGKTCVAVDGNDVASVEAYRCIAQSDFQHYLKLVNNLTTFTARSSVTKKVLLGPLHLDEHDLAKAIGSIATLDASKVSFKYDKPSDTYTLYAQSEPKTTLCLANASVPTNASVAGDDSCLATGSAPDTGAVDTEPKKLADGAAGQMPYSFPLFASNSDETTSTQKYCERFGRAIASLQDEAKRQTRGFSADTEAALTDTGAASTKLSMRMEIRSVGEMIQFLGDLLEYQDAIRANPGIGELNAPLTFGYCVDDGNQPHCADVLFNVSQTLQSDSRFAVSYRGATYYIPKYNRPGNSLSRIAPCSQNNSSVGTDASCIDHTLEVLSVVHQLIDLQRSAQDVQETPYVSIVP